MRFCENFIFYSSRLGIKNGGCSVYHKTNRETMVDIGDSVRGKDCYIIQTGTKYEDIIYCHLILIFDEFSSSIEIATTT